MVADQWVPPVFESPSKLDLEAVVRSVDFEDLRESATIPIRATCQATGEVREAEVVVHPKA